MRISDWSSDVCSSDLLQFAARHIAFLFVDMPALRSLDLEDDDVMIVIMRQKALRARRRDIGVDLRLEIELDLQPARERRDRADITFEPVEDDREARREIIAQRDHVDRAIAEAIEIGRAHV